MGYDDRLGEGDTCIRRAGLEPDGYSLFTDCHRLYMQGIRRALRERLESAYGEDWFARGVLAAVGEGQREAIERDLANHPDPDLMNHLDAGHFARIVSRSHAAAFSGVFPALDVVLGQFDRLRMIRNDWAHVVPESLSLGRSVSAAQLMKDVLLKLGCVEAVEIAGVLDERNAEQVESSMLEAISFLNHEADDIDRDGRPEDLPARPEILWQTLQSYLVTEAWVDSLEQSEQRGDGRHRRVRVTVRVSNIAPASEDRPEVEFTGVAVEATVSSGRGTDAGPRNLSSGESLERQFEIFANEVAQFEYRVAGSVDRGKYFRVQRKGGLPAEIVRPVLNQFAEQFESIGVKQPFNEALAAIADVQPTMSLVDASRVRQDLEQLRQTIIEEKLAAVRRLIDEFHLQNSGSLGTSCNEIVLLMRDLGPKLQAVDDAIGGTNLDAIETAVNDLRQLQLSVLQVEETILKARNG